MQKVLLALVPALLAYLTAAEQGEAELAKALALMSTTIHTQSQQLLRCEQARND